MTTSGSLASTILCSNVPTYSLLFFGLTIFRSSIQDGTKFVLSTEQFPPDDILESLYKWRIRESEKLKTILEVYNLEIHQKKSKPDDHRMKTMVKGSIGQDLKTRNFDARNGRIESNMPVKNQREQRHVLKRTRRWLAVASQ